MLILFAWYKDLIQPMDSLHALPKKLQENRVNNWINVIKIWQILIWGFEQNSTMASLWKRFQNYILNKVICKIICMNVYGSVLLYFNFNLINWVMYLIFPIYCKKSLTKQNCSRKYKRHLHYQWNMLAVRVSQVVLIQLENCQQ